MRISHPIGRKAGHYTSRIMGGLMLGSRVAAQYPACERL